MTRPEQDMELMVLLVQATELMARLLGPPGSLLQRRAVTASRFTALTAQARYVDLSRHCMLIDQFTFVVKLY